VGGLGGAGFLAAVVLLAQGDPEKTHEGMDYLYDVCAVLGGTLLVCQVLLSLLGVGHHHELGGGDVDHDFGGHDVGHDVGHGAEAGHDVGGHEHHAAGHEAHSAWYVRVLTFRSVVAALLFFGLAGRAADASGLAPVLTLAVALAAGAGALFVVAWTMQALYRLRAEGTVRIDRAVGRGGTVYLTVPANKGGLGKVLLNVQNRTVEYQALTAHQSLPTGTPVTCVAVVNADTVEVAQAKKP
jgi:hypothetical protein